MCNRQKEALKTERNNRACVAVHLKNEKGKNYLRRMTQLFTGIFYINEPKK